MKTINKLRSAIQVVLILFPLLFAACQDEQVDPCENTIASDKDLFLTAWVQVLDENDNPMEGVEVTYKFELHACSGDIVTLATYTQTTDTTGTVGPETQKITLGNTEDEAFLTANAPNLQSSVNFANKTYKYNDFDDDDNVLYTLVIRKQ